MQIIEENPGSNTIRIDPAVAQEFEGVVELNGSNNIVAIGRPLGSSGFYVRMDGNAKLRIGHGGTLNRQEFHLLAPGRITIGEGCSWSGPVIVTMHEKAVIEIGAHCLIAGGAAISASHVHKIYDRTTGKRLNGPRNVKIGDRVWIGTEASIFPGADIGHDSVVGKGAYVSKAYPPHCLLVGAPARIARENIVWEP